MFRKIYYIIFIFMLPSCSYYSFKGSIPAHIKNVVIPPIVNKTSEYTVATILNEKFLDLMLLENILDIVSYENADSKVKQWSINYVSYHALHFKKQRRLFR